jgi:hypothetical protein
VINESRRTPMSELVTTVRQRHRSAEEWWTLVEGWRASGKSSSAWCDEQGIGRESLRRWKKRLGARPKEAALVQVPLSAMARGVRLRITREGEVEFVGVLTAELIGLVVEALRERARVR